MSKKPFILSLLLGLGLIVISLLYYIFPEKQGQTRDLNKSIFVSPAPKKEVIKKGTCSKNSDCMLVVRLDKCCSCPQVILKDKFIKSSILVEYKHSKDYSGSKTVDCENVDCFPCFPAQSAACEEGVCELSI
ncbi:hypothetical protein ACFLZ1_03195 [Patescibacteria group bacterium]